jgi:sucrose-6-phosphate hydrolase SacC (GH32 family)
MKKHWLYLLLLFSCRPAKEVYMFTSFREPATDGLHFLYSYDGYKWTDIKGSFLQPLPGKVFRDPSIVKGPDSIYHLVWTTSWKGNEGFGYAASKDLKHWSEQRVVNVMEDEPTTVNVWAPEIFYDDEQQQYIIIWASTIPARFARGIEAEDNNHRMYYTTTKDFITFSKAALFYDPGFSVIDAVIVKMEKGKYALVLKDNTRPERDLKIAFSTKATGPYIDCSAAITGHLTEGPTTIRIKDEWLIYYDAYGDKKYSAIKTKDFKTFTDISQQVSLPAGHKHGTIFKTTRKTLQSLIQQ